MSPEPQYLDLGVEAPAPQALLQAIIDSSDDAIISKDLNSTVTSWNKSAERIFGYSAQEMIGESITKLIPPERIAEEDEILRKIRAGERLDHFETVRRRKDGCLIEVVVSISPVYSVTGKIVGASKVARDVSEAKRIARADMLLAAIVNSSDDAIVSKSLDGIITSWNAAAERIFGYTASEIIGQSVLKLIPTERHYEEPKILERLRRGERMDHFETIRRRKNGELFPVSLTISPVKNSSGEIVGASKIAHDISEAKRISCELELLLESERNARIQAEHANRMKDEFLATVSHELRTPLNAIVGWTAVLVESGKCNDPEVAEGIDVIKQNATMQAELIEDLLDLARITSGKMVLRTQSVDLNAIVRNAIASVQHSADAKRIFLRPILGDLRGDLSGDPRRLQQVVWNLLTNAIKFTPNDGRVWITITQVGSHVEIKVSDNGRGISPELLPYVFERFRQADSTTTRQHGGLGIGLALAKQLVELHGGKISAESGGLGQGATFTVTLPIAAVWTKDAPHDGQNAPDTSELGDLTGIKVIAVDDDVNSLEVVKRILSARGAEVRAASSTDNALEMLKTFSPDVALSDIGMPGRDGYEFVRRLREIPFFTGIPAAALTALARPEDRTRALNAGFQIHIAKPIAAAELIAVVRSLAKLHSARVGRHPS